MWQDLLSQPAGRQLTAVLMHFVWQGAVLAVVLAALLRTGWLRRSGQRYAAGVAALLAMSLFPVVTLGWLWATEPAAVLSEPTERSPVDPGLAEAMRWAELPREASQPPSFFSIDRWQPYVLVFWSLGVALMTGRLLMGMVGLFGFRRHRQPLPVALADAATRLAERMGLERRVRFFLSSSRRVSEAVVFGFVRPVVLLPLAWAGDMPLAVLESVLAHELAHVRRYDLWVNLWQRIVETLLFYHPAVWWVSRQIRLEREMCCDELAVLMTGHRVAYAEALEQVARRRIGRPAPQFSAAFRGGKNMHLLSRVRNVLGVRPSAGTTWWPVGMLAVLLPLGLWISGNGLSGISAAFADDPAEVQRDRQRDGQRERDRDRDRDAHRHDHEHGDRDRHVERDVLLRRELGQRQAQVLQLRKLADLEKAQREALEHQNRVLGVLRLSEDAEQRDILLDRVQAQPLSIRRVLLQELESGEPLSIIARLQDDAAARDEAAGDRDRRRLNEARRAANEDELLEAVRRLSRELEILRAEVRAMREQAPRRESESRDRDAHEADQRERDARARVFEARDRLREQQNRDEGAGTEEEQVRDEARRNWEHAAEALARYYRDQDDLAKSQWREAQQQRQRAIAEEQQAVADQNLDEAKQRLAEALRDAQAARDRAEAVAEEARSQAEQYRRVVEELRKQASQRDKDREQGDDQEEQSDEADDEENEDHDDGADRDDTDRDEADQASTA